MTRGLKLLLAMAITLASSGAASAAIIYDNGGPAYTYGYSSEFAHPPQQFGDDFTLNAAATVRDVHWWGGYAPGGNVATDDFTIRIFEMTGGVPDVNPSYSDLLGSAVTRTDGGGDFSSFSPPFRVLAYDANIVPVALGPGSYMLSIVNNTDPGGDSWSWAVAGDLGITFIRFVEGDPWIGILGQMAFNLTDDQGTAVPEPATLLLLGSGLAGLGGAAWRRRRRAGPGAG